MLFDTRTLNGLAAGTVTTALRRWDVARVQEGSTTRTAVGIVEVTSVDTIDETDIDETLAHSAGFKDARDATRWVRRKGSGTVHVLGLRLVGADPRVALREETNLDDDARAEIAEALGRLDAAAREPWTSDLMAAIEAGEGTAAAVLAEQLSTTKDQLKRRVRRLKDLGLTESLEVGYRLSPRGLIWLARAR